MMDFMKIKILFYAKNAVKDAKLVKMSMIIVHLALILNSNSIVF